MKMILLAGALIAAPTFAQVPATSDGQAVPRCSATVRDGCVQDERFASQTSTPSRGIDNNAAHRPGTAMRSRHVAARRVVRSN